MTKTTKKSHVFIGKTIQKRYLEKQLSHHPSSPRFHSKLSSLPLSFETL